jgi:hypothetical protein
MRRNVDALLPARILIAVAIVGINVSRADAQLSAVPAATDQQQVFAAIFSRLIEDAIPLEYEKQKDWGATTEITTGVKLEGHGFDARLKKRKRAVNHGVWKHYKLRLIEPRQNLAVQLANLQTIAPGRVAFKLQATAKLDAWARAKAYQYGVHIIALEMESDMRVRLAIEGEFGMETSGSGASTAIAFIPVVTAAQLAIDDFHLRRVSNASGPIIRELGDGVRHVVEDELNGPRLVEKLNRAIERKRDRLTFHPIELLEAKWPFAMWPAVAPQIAPSRVAANVGQGPP